MSSFYLFWLLTKNFLTNILYFLISILKKQIKYLREHLEILSLSGTLSSTGGNNLHISLSNKDGQVFGGHVHGELNVFTTVECVIGDCSDLVFTREHDYQSGFKELTIKPKK